jgi:septal ring factor EnvC (AmiA/AmiB activator)
MSLYGYNEGLLRQVGDRVRAGEPLARVGSSGESADSGLYFELRREGKPFDPMRWVAQ